MKAIRSFPWWVKLAAVVVVFVLFGVAKSCTASDPDEELRQKAGEDLSSYIASKPELKGKVNLIDVIVNDGDIVAEFSSHDGGIFCRMAVDAPNKSVSRYHVIKWKPAKKDTAATVAGRLTEKDGTGLGCIQVLPMTGIGDDGQLSSS